MNLLDAILGGKASPVSKLGSKFGLSENKTAEVIKSFLPALTNGIKKNINQSGGVENLITALGRGEHDRYLDDPDALDSDNAVTDGNAILGHLLGSKNTSRTLAGRTAETTGIDSGLLKKMLPVVAGLTMGALKKQGNSSGILSGLTSNSSSSSTGSLLSLLDADGDGSPIDDILGFASKLF